MTYAPVTLKSKSVPNNFGGMRADGNRISMTGAVGNNIQTRDATATPVNSPITNGSSSGLTLVVPQNATQMTVISSVACLVGEDSTYTYGLSIPANTITKFDVANQQNVYLKPSNATNTINFYFNIV